MKVSIIIPTYNRNNLLRLCLDQLTPSYQQVDAESYEIIVSDDSKTGEAKLLIEEEYAWVTWVKGPGKGPAANRNAGAKMAGGKWLIFIDDDCLPDENLIKTYIENIRNAGKARAFEGAIREQTKRKRYDEEAPINDSKGGYFWSCNICVEKKLFFEINGFDECFPFADMEDTDIYGRLTKVTIVPFLKDTFVIHPWRRVVAFKGYRKWLVSHRYISKKNGVKLNWRFRLEKTKLLIGWIFANFRELVHYRFKGGLFFLERLYFQILIIFLRYD